MLTTVTYGLQQLEQSSFVETESNSQEVDLLALKEVELPQFLLSMSEAAFNRSE